MGYQSIGVWIKDLLFIPPPPILEQFVAFSAGVKYTSFGYIKTPLSSLDYNYLLKIEGGDTLYYRCGLCLGLGAIQTLTWAVTSQNIS